MSTPLIYVIPLLSLLMACATSVQGEAKDPDAGQEDADAAVNTPDANTPSGLELSLMPATLSIGIGETGDFTGEVTEDSNPVSRPLLWESADSSIVSIDNSGQVTGVAVGSTTIQLTIADTDITEMANVTVTAASCVDGAGNNGDSCAGVHQGVDIWRCTVSSNVGGNTVSQVCRDSGDGPKWITFNVDPIDCCTCTGSSSTPGCCALNSPTPGC